MRRTGTYGLNQPITTGLGAGPGLAAQGASQQATATQMLGRVAEEETARNIGNRQRERERKAGNAQLGASVGALAGAQYGAALGPWGAVIGGLVGAVGSQLF